ncbi:MAG: 3-deoxy-D-manno-octulosonic acid transferase [Chlorobi bacterium]|nr:3-deoxy-D-manno-octulosonic acid transferase [Chlorobiota bacterium]
MKKFWFIVYNVLVIPWLTLFFSFVSLFNDKVKRGYTERKKQNPKLIKKFEKLDRSKKLLWFHSASLGEFEQAKPIIQKIKQEQDVNILVTFFSPSGYDNSQKYPYADVIAYLPVDSVKNVREFISISNPDIAIFMRYDVWPNLIWELGNRNIPSMIVDATMRKNSKRKFPIIKGFHTSLYQNFSKILTVSKEDLIGFKDFKIDKNKLDVIGETRFDRVYQKSLSARDKKLFKDGLFEGKKVFVIGSSSEYDENVVFPAFEKLLKNDPNCVLIIAPHEPDLITLEKIENTFAGIEKTIRFSSKNNYQGEKIIIIDSIGILLTLYYYADVVYVGGSFKEGVHNVLEPAVYGIPLFFGPKIENSQEALELVKRGGGKIVNNKKEAYRMLRTFSNDPAERKRMGDICLEYVNENIGASDKIIAEIHNLLSVNRS